MMRTALPLLLCLAAALTAAPAAAQPAAVFDDAYMAEIRAESAALRARIQQWPSGMQALNAQVSAALRADDYAQARGLAEEMARQDPGNADVRHFLGKLLAMRGQPLQAIARFDEAIALNPGNKWFYVSKSGVQADLNDMPNALQTTRVLTQKFPDWSIGYNVQAAILDALDHTPQALQAYQHAIGVPPRSAQILTNLGLLQRRLGRVADARKSYEAALDVQPGYARAQAELASLPR